MQGVMEGPEEFAEGLCFGARSLFGHVVGGSAGSVSLIASSLGEIISSLSFDEDYKKVFFLLVEITLNITISYII